MSLGNVIFCCVLCIGLQNALRWHVKISHTTSTYLVNQDSYISKLYGFNYLHTKHKRTSRPYTLHQLHEYVSCCKRQSGAQFVQPRFAVVYLGYLSKVTPCIAVPGPTRLLRPSRYSIPQQPCDSSPQLLHLQQSAQRPVRYFMPQPTQRISWQIICTMQLRGCTPCRAGLLNLCQRHTHPARNQGHAAEQSTQLSIVYSLFPQDDSVPRGDGISSQLANSRTCIDCEIGAGEQDSKGHLPSQGLLLPLLL